MRRFYNKDKTALNSFKFLFENKTYKQTILKNTFWLSLAQGFSGLINFVLMIYVIRVFGPTEYGKFAFAFSFVSLFSTFFDFGLSTVVTREFAKDKDKEEGFLDILILKVALGIGILFLVVIFSFFITSDGFIRKIILILGMYILMLESINLFYGFFRARQRMEIEAILRILQSIFMGIAILWVIFIYPSILNLSVAYMGATFLASVIIFGFFIFKSDIKINLHLSFNKSLWKEFFLMGWYLALAKGAADITIYTGSVMLGYWAQMSEVGWYNAAYKISGLILFPMAMVSSAIFPALINILKESKERFLKYWEFWFKGTIFFSVLLFFTVLAKANEIIEFVYSKNFLPSALVLKILIFMTTLVYVHTLYYHLLLIFDQQKRIFFVMLSAAIVNVILNFILIPKYNLYGAAVATAITHFILLCEYLMITSRHTFIRPISTQVFFTLLIAVISGMLMYYGLSALDMIKVHLFTSLLSGISVYSFLFVAFYKIGKNFVFLKA